jgi:hypothetical protein
MLVVVSILLRDRPLQQTSLSNFVIDAFVNILPVFAESFFGPICQIHACTISVPTVHKQQLNGLSLLFHRYCDGRASPVAIVGARDTRAVATSPLSSDESSGISSLLLLALTITMSSLTSEDR